MFAIFSRNFLFLFLQLREEMENLKEINHSHQNMSNQAIAVDTEVTPEEYHRIEVFYVLIIFLN
jgi:hypothetical protein